MKQVFVVLLLLLSNQVFSESFRVALPDEDYPPIHFVDKNNKGILNRVLSKFSAESGYKIEYVFVPKVRSAKLIHDNHIDARMESEAWQIDNHPHYWSEGIVIIEDVIITGRYVDPRIFDIKNKFISGVLLGHYGYIYPQYEPLVKNKTLHRENFYSDLALLKSLHNNTYEQKRFAIMSRAVFNWYCKKYPEFKQLNMSDFNVGMEPLQLQFSHSPRGRARADAFNIFLKKLKANGELARIINSYQ
ncbi:hypothetical protein [Pseudoalteromonas atlantica]|uniref:hypothetical protein n=1 Tax=Pseudoalteromonas atlantica TaxID=288 RepID=UPI003735B876